jgi:hypothetical protein
MISVKYLDNTKELNLDSDITNGEFQNKILNTFHLCVYDIKFIKLKYNDNEYICGDNEMSFYSKFQPENLIEAIVIDKNSNEIYNTNIDYHRIREYFNTYLISLNDEIYIETSPDNIEDISFNIEEINNNNERLINDIESHPNDIETPPNDIETPPNDIETPPNDIETPPNDIETPANHIENTRYQIDNMSGTIRIYRNTNSSRSIPNITSLNIMEYILRNTLIRAVNDELISTQEDVKIVTRKTDFDNIEVINNFEEDINCSICLEPMNTDVIQVKCGHHYHKECGQKWFCECSNKCPVCKIEISDGIPLE